MPYHDYDAARAEFAKDTIEPFSFTLGGEDFVLLNEPMYGDVAELWEAPPVDVDEANCLFVSLKFVKRMLHPDDRDRFEKMLYRIPSRHALILLKLCADIGAHYVPFQETPADSSTSRPSSGGRRSKERGGGGTRSSGNVRRKPSSSSTSSSR